MAKDSHPASVPEIIPPQPIDRIAKPIARLMEIVKTPRE